MGEHYRQEEPVHVSRGDSSEKFVATGTPKTAAQVRSQEGLQYSPNEGMQRGREGQTDETRQMQEIRNEDQRRDVQIVHEGRQGAGPMRSTIAPLRECDPGLQSQLLVVYCSHFACQCLTTGERRILTVQFSTQDHR